LPPRSRSELSAISRLRDFLINFACVKLLLIKNKIMNYSNCCSGFICQLFISERKRNDATKLTSMFLKSFCSKKRNDIVRKFTFLNNGRFDPILPPNVGIYGFIVPFTFEDEDANSLALLSRAATIFCEFYTFGVYFDDAKFRSDYYRCLDDHQRDQLMEWSRLQFGE
ncbi:MAG: hypothetical protein RSB32_07900, partial [Mucinivorans sp.]